MDEAAQTQIPKVPSGAEGQPFSESAYTPFKLMSYHLYQLRTDYEALMRQPNYKDNGFRRRVVDSASILFNESKETGFTLDEREKISRLLSAMNSKDEQIFNLVNSFHGNITFAMQGMIDEYLSEFRDLAYKFLSAENAALQNHAQLYKTKKTITQIDRLERVFVVGRRTPLYNGYGIPISPEMLLLASLLVLRTKAELNNVMPIEGELGFGKSTFAWALGSTIAWLQGKPNFLVRDHFLFNESADYFEERIRTAAPEDIIIPDEVGNQANKRRFYERDQVASLDRLKLSRYKKISLFPCWRTVKELDSQLMSIANGIISITEKAVDERTYGMAQLRTFNRNKYAKSEEFKPYVAKNMIAYTPEEANAIIEEFDEFNLLKIPFYRIPLEIWNKEYEPVKDAANSVARSTNTSVKKHAELLYYEFLAALPDNCTCVTSVQLRDFSRDKNFILQFGALTSMVAKAIGSSRTKIFKQNVNPQEQWDGYFDVDNYIGDYLKKIKAQYKGVVETNKANKKVDKK